MTPPAPPTSRLVPAVPADVTPGPTTVWPSQDEEETRYIPYEEEAHIIRSGSKEHRSTSSVAHSVGTSPLFNNTTAVPLAPSHRAKKAPSAKNWHPGE